MGFFGVLALIFITLKLVGTIVWSWWWVLAPIWGPIALAVVIPVLAAVFVGLMEALGSFKRRR